MKILDIPRENRPRERFLKQGARREEERLDDIYKI